MRNIVILDGYTANKGDLSWKGLNALGNVTVYDRTRPEDVLARAAEAEVVLTNKVQLGRKEIEMLPRLRYIGVLATGYNVVDIESAKEHGIVVTNVPSYSTESVAQMVFAHLLTVTHHVEHYAEMNRRGRWTESVDFCYTDGLLIELHGKRIGIVGLGNIGHRVAEIALAFGMKVMAVTSKGTEMLPQGIEKCGMEEMMAQCDVVTLHCPLTEKTHQMINSRSLSRMKRTAILINTGRGPLVNDNDVAEALKEGRLGAYCADVLTEEPPRIGNALLECERAYITPHIAWATGEARERLIRVATENVKAFVEGRPVNMV